MSNTLLAAAISAVTNSNVISYGDYCKGGKDGYMQLDIYDLHQRYLIYGTDDINNKLPSYVFIKSFNKTIAINVNLNETIDQLKAKIQYEEGILVGHQRLLFNDRIVEGKATLAHYGIRHDSILCLVLRLRGGGMGSFIDPDQFDPYYDYDFTNVNDEGRTFMRGNVEYKRPCGWKRFALNVLDKYEDSTWLGVNNRQYLTSSVQNEWPVSYHGTANHNCKSIVEDGYLLSKGERFLYGPGIYSTPDIDVAYKYATKITHEGEDYRVVFQNRVNPNNLKIIPKEETGVGEYWVSPDGADLRPYGICIKKEGLQPYQTKREGDLFDIIGIMFLKGIFGFGI